MEKHVIMFYRVKGIDAEWKYYLVNDQVSAMTDGEYDFITHYKNNPVWEVVTVPVALPK